MVRSFKRALRHLPGTIRAVVLIIVLLISSFASVQPSLAAGNLITVTVFRDYNGDGIQQAREPGIRGVTVTATDASGAVFPLTDGALTPGIYTASPANAAYRIEVSGYPAPLVPGAHGTGSATTVSFVDTTGGTAAEGVGLQNPDEYSGPVGSPATFPSFVTSIYESGPIAGNNGGTVVSFANNATGTVVPATLATVAQVGATFGVAYQRSSKNVYAAAFLKRFAAFGPNGPGAIYYIPGGVGVPALLTTIANAGPDPHTTNAHWLNDEPPIATAKLKDDGAQMDAFNGVYEDSLGAMTFDDTTNTLYVTNLYDRTLHALLLNAAGTAVVTDTPIDLTAAAGICDFANNFRPMGLGLNDGIVYIGGVCSGEFNGTGRLAGGQTDAQNVKAFVITYKPGVGLNAAPVLQVNLAEPYGGSNGVDMRGCADLSRTCNPLPSAIGMGGAAGTGTKPFGGTGYTGYTSAWRPWASTWSLAANHPYNNGSSNIVTYDSPQVAQITFDNGNLILGLRDRFGDEGNGSGAYDTSYVVATGNYSNTTNYSTTTGGDILRACGNPSAGWTIENNGSCGGVTTGGANSHLGLGGGQYYYQQFYPVNHDNEPVGGVAQVAGFPNVTTTVFDPLNGGGPFGTGGARWFGDVGATAGQNNQSVLLQTSGNPRFGKADGMGLLVPLLNIPPLEIGNRVWLNTGGGNPANAGNGLQNPGESGIAGVVVNLYNAAGTLIGTATTDASGNYYFNAGNVAGGLSPNTQYTVVIAPSNFLVGGPLYNAGNPYTPTTPNAGTDTAIDSNGVSVTVPTQGVFQDGATLTTGGSGVNDHTYDFGFNPPPPTATPTSTNTPSNTPTNTATDTPTSTFTNTPTDTPSDTATNTPSNTPTNTATDTPTSTFTNTPTDTPSDTATNTPSNTPTNTATDTPTSTFTNTPTDTPSDTATNTPSNTPTNTATDTPTSTFTNTPSDTATGTPSNTPTNTSTTVPSNTPTSSATSTGTTVPSNTPTSTATNTSTTVPSNTPSNTATNTSTTVPSNTPTSTGTTVPSNTPTSTATNTSTTVPSNTPSNTATSSATSTGTLLPINTATNTSTATSTGSATATGTLGSTATTTTTGTPGSTPTATATSTITATGTQSVTATLTLAATTTGPTGTPNLNISDPILAKVADVQLAQPGSPVHFTLTVTNIGTAPATNVVVTDPVPSPLILQSASASQGTFSVNLATNTVIFNVGTVNPGQVITLKVNTIVSSSTVPPVTITNTATLTGGGHTTTSSTAVHVTAGGLPATGEHPADNSSNPGVWIGLMIVVLLGGLLSMRALRRRRI